MNKEEIVDLGFILFIVLLEALQTWVAYGWVKAMIHFFVLFAAVILAYTAGRCQ